MKATFYVQFKAEFYRANEKYGKTSNDMKSLKAVKVTQTRPATREGDLTVEFDIDIPGEIVIPRIEASMNVLGATIQNLRQTEKDLR